MGKNVVILGSQWGDEGKGKIVDLLTDKAALVARFKAATMLATHWLSTARKRHYTLFHPVFCATMLPV